MAAEGGEELPVLPDPVLLRILELLPLRDRLRAARVCRHWRRLALDREVWRDVDLSPYRLSSRTLWRLLRGGSLGSPLRALALRGSLLSGGPQPLLILTPALLSALGKRCPGLRRLSLTELDLRPVPYGTLPASVTSLELRRCEISSSSSSSSSSSWFRGSAPGPSPRLRHLLLLHVPAFSDGHLLRAVSHNPLKTLKLSGTYRVTDLGLQRAAPHLGELELLSLRGCGLADPSALSLGKHLKKLRALEIEDAPGLTATGLAGLLALQTLESVSLQLGHQIPPETLVGLPRLRSLLGGVLEGEEGDKTQGSSAADISQPT